VIHTDANQPEIVRVLRAAGCSVEVLSPVARGGLPDLLVGRAGVSYLLEVKAPKGKLNERQERWALAWRGRPVAIVRTPEDALGAVGLLGQNTR